MITDMINMGRLRETAIGLSPASLLGRINSNLHGAAHAMAVSVAFILLSASSAYASGKVASVSEVVIDAADSTTLFARDADVIRAPASLTKMMTLFLVFDALDDNVLGLDDLLPVSRHAANQQPSRLGLKPGQALKVRAAIRAVAVNSANDVAVVLAERLGRSEKAFAVQMTRKARQLGMRRTKFANATGLTDPENRTTAHDIGLLSLALIRRHAHYYPYFNTRSIRWNDRVLPNHNHLLGRVPGLDGIKTGYTADAGYNLAASARRKGKRVIAVVMGERSAAKRDVRVSNLLENGFVSKPTHSRIQPKTKPTNVQKSIH